MRLASLRLLAACLMSLLVGACAPGSLSSGTFEVTVYLEESSEDLSSVSFELAYAGGGTFVGSGSAVSCTASPSGASSTFTDDDADEELSAVVTLSSGFMSEDDNLAVCSYQSTVAPTSANFTITVKSAFDYLGDALSSLPTVSIKSINAVVTSSTVSTSTVTTTSTSLTTTSTLGS